MTQGGQLDLFGAKPSQSSAPVARAPEAPARSEWPEAWNNDRAATLTRLARLEKWTIAETAFYLRCTCQHVSNLMDCGAIRATNISSVPGGRPLYRVYRESVLAREQAGAVGGEK